VNVLLSLQYINHIKNITDLDLLDSISFDFQVNYAVGQRTLGELYIAERTLYYFRERIYQYSVENPDQEDLLYGQFTKLLNEFASKAKVKQTIEDAVKISNVIKTKVGMAVLG